MAKTEGYSVRREIMDALVKLMAEKSYMDITVTDVINTAEVARASFYRNFESINDVIDRIAEDISEELTDDVLPVLRSSDERKWREYLFSHFYRFSRMLKHIGDIQPQNMRVLLSRMDNALRSGENVLQSDDLWEKYRIAGKVGLISSITKRWLDDGMQETPEEMIDCIMSFILKL